ncbi:hypothetical protein IVA87_08015 [Bradyrhizobium sp. 147]|uniref:hypothetical protein n=1 Tax=Bradyrhizobium sp. 147 TaxID=2782623 RepID=UPI001FF84C55|nr:hypothetical protein [Bradyrhizobium sp. 147]MCK1679405.1 hypothetical protein [Bradyrhizobium sp. 147]
MSSYERSRTALARAYEALARTSSINEEIAERNRLRDLGLLPEPYPPPPPPPEPQQAAEDADDADGERLMTLAFFEGIMLELILQLRSEWRSELDKLRAEVVTLKNERMSDDHTS